VSTGRSNKLVGQTGEYLVCAELGRRGLIATPFAGNVPGFDVLAADDQCRALPIQVKTTAGDSWPTQADQWMHITYDAETLSQVPGDPVEIDNPDLVHVYVALATESSPHDRFFVLTKLDLQRAIIKDYCDWMNTKGWRRPRKPQSLRCQFWISAIQEYEDNWKLIEERIAAQGPAKA
jgi:hypothetical protein